MSKSALGIIGLLGGIYIVAIIIGPIPVCILHATVLLDKLLMILWLIFLIIAIAAPSLAWLLIFFHSVLYILPWSFYD